jgi:hypothetical protein
VTYQITNNIGSMSNSQLQQHSSGSQSISSGLDVAALKELIEIVRSSLESAKLPTAARREVSAELDTLKAQASSPKPKLNIIVESLKSLRTISEEAAENILGGGVLMKIDSFLRGIAG